MGWGPWDRWGRGGPGGRGTDGGGMWGRLGACQTDGCTQDRRGRDAGRTGRGDVGQTGDGSRTDGGGHGADGGGTWGRPGGRGTDSGDTDSRGSGPSSGPWGLLLAVTTWTSPGHGVSSAGAECSQARVLPGSWLRGQACGPWGSAPRGWGLQGPWLHPGPASEAPQHRLAERRRERVRGDAQPGATGSTAGVLLPGRRGLRVACSED